MDICKVSIIKCQTQSSSVAIRHVGYKAGENTHMQLAFPAPDIHAMPHLVWLHINVTCLVLHTILTLIRTLDWVEEFGN